MAHLPPNAAIFSPSVARAAASAAKEWSYIDAWLQRKFPGRGPPPFERNADTLRALLALASANEAADEERALIARLEAETLSQLRAHEHAQDQPQPSHPDDTTPPPLTLHSAREAILTSLEASLTRDGQTALTSLAALALQTNTPLPTPSTLAATLHALTTETLTLSQTLARTQTLSTYLTQEATQTTALSTSLQQPNPHDADDDHNPSTADPPPPGGGATGYHPPANLSLQNLTTQRRIKSLSARLPELRDKAASLARSVGNTTTTKGGSNSSSSIPHLIQEEASYLALQAIKRDLEAQLNAFAGLPPDVELARQEVEGLREELRGLVARRDEVFEGLVERETPRKGYKSRGGGGR